MRRGIREPGLPRKGSMRRLLSGDQWLPPGAEEGIEFLSRMGVDGLIVTPALAL
ncbi:MAG: hypothetical protein M3N54_15825 [Acidobacteriota bacterium]|nr:hypothetical protein [Acidobacteriota bacterium]